MASDGMIEDIYPASYLQVGMLLEANLDSNGTYHDVFSYLIKKKLNSEQVLAIWKQLANKHELLRASFVLNNDNGWNVIIHKSIEIEYQIYANSNTQELVEEERLQDFDHNKPGLFRLLLNDHGESFSIIFSFHHVIADGWSVAHLINEFIQSYTNDKPIIQNVRLRYGEFIRNELHAIKNHDNIAFWKEYLNDIEITKVRWKFDAKKSQNSLYTSAFTLSQTQARAAHKIAKDLKISVDSIFLFAYLNVLSYFTNSLDIIIGLIVNNRLEKEGGDQLFGLFLNTIPFRFQFDHQKGKIDELIKVFNNKVKLFQYKHVPYGYIKALFKKELYDFAFNFSHFDILNDIQDISSGDIYERTNIPFILNVSQVKDSFFSINFTAHDNYVSASFLEYFVKYYKFFLSNILERQDNNLGLIEEDYIKILYEFNTTHKSYPSNRTIFYLFEEQVDKNPDSVAVICESLQVTYGELNKRANQLAHYLRQCGVKNETLVAISVERSLEMVIGLLAILKSGGVYVPLDPSYPEERLKFILEDTNVSILITQSHLNKIFKEYNKQVVVLDKDWHKIAKEPVHNPNLITTDNNLAYVIYTSGSTGKPKGVGNTYGSIYNRFIWTLDTYPISKADSFLHIATVGFDISIWEMLFPIIGGGKLVIAKDEENKDPQHIFNMIMRCGISVIHFVPSLLEVFLDQISLSDKIPIKQVVCGGEGISVKLKERFFQKLNANLYHAYGPTEAAISVTHWDCQEAIEQNVVPIGRPIWNIEVYILDRSMSPIPIGVIGELYIGGVGLARGYLNKPDLTAERFVANPFLTVQGGEENRASLRLYRTGDLARYLPDGNIEFLGRADDQVKIRGYRIELMEIENCICNCQGVKKSVVLIKESKKEDKYLIAYYVSESGVREDEIIEHLENKLPNYMIPSFVLRVDEIPLTKNDKVDKKQLLMLNLYPHMQLSVPTTKLEQEILKIWLNVLDIDVDINSNFFDLGGNSLLALKVISKLKKKCFFNLNVKDLFIYPTINKLASYINSNEYRKRMK